MRMLLAATLFALAVPGVSYAHGASGHGYTSTVVRIVDARGIDATPSADGHFSFTAPRGKTVVVHGYHGEPYVKFQNGTIYVNRRAPTTYVNEERPPPDGTSAKADADWEARDAGLTYAWHDHRTQWLATEPPAAVEAEPKLPHHVFDWKVDGTVDGKPFVVDGSLDWTPGKSGPGYEWLSFLAIAGAVLYVAFALISRRAGRGA
jgi:hypothetical protein